MNNRRLQFVLQETLQAMRRRGLREAQELLRNSTLGHDLPGPHDKDMVRDVLKGLDRGSDNTLYQALDVMAHRLRDEPGKTKYEFVMQKARRPYTDAGLEACLQLSSKLTAVIDLETNGAAEALTQGTEPVNTEQLRAALAESEANDAIVAAAAERAARLTYLSGLATATGKLIAAIQVASNNPINLTVYAKELKPLAEELGARIVPTNTAGAFLILVRG